MSHTPNTDPSSSLTQPHLDPAETRACLAASLAAYDDFAQKNILPPEGYKLLERFTGWDAIFGTGVEERFGLVFQPEADPSTLLIAFRGTVSWMDWYENLWVRTERFTPVQPPTPPLDDVYVSSGFFSIYSDKGDAMTASMQGQLFAILDALKPKQVIITGHSLGGALASLFALDVAISRASVSPRVTTFASPRVGTSDWKSTYDDRFQLKDRTFRVLNYWDWVPTLPPSSLGYQHIGEPFLCAFSVKDAVLPYLVDAHSLDNYDTVLRHALDHQPQVFVGEFTDAVNPAWKMISTAPPAAAQPQWADVHPATWAARGSIPTGDETALRPSGS